MLSCCTFCNKLHLKVPKRWHSFVPFGFVPINWSSVSDKLQHRVKIKLHRWSFEVLGWPRVNDTQSLDRSRPTTHFASFRRCTGAHTAGTDWVAEDWLLGAVVRETWCCKNMDLWKSRISEKSSILGVFDTHCIYWDGGVGWSSRNHKYLRFDFNI